MIRSIRNQKSKSRNGAPRGVALIAVVITLVIVALMMSALAWQIVSNRRMLKHRQYQLQSEWLARAGVEGAVARLLDGPDGFVDESSGPIERSVLRIEAQADPDYPGMYRIVSEATYPADAIDRVTRKVERRFQRRVDGQTIRLERATTDEEAPPRPE